MTTSHEETRENSQNRKVGSYHMLEDYVYLNQLWLSCHCIISLVSKIPIKVGSEITRIQKELLWEWSNEGKNIVWVKWERLCKTIEAGGLKVEDID